MARWLSLNAAAVRVPALDAVLPSQAITGRYKPCLNTTRYRVTCELFKPCIYTAKYRRFYRCYGMLARRVFKGIQPISTGVTVVLVKLHI
jgi:hypothetical protein